MFYLNRLFNRYFMDTFGFLWIYYWIFMDSIGFLRILLDFYGLY